MAVRRKYKVPHFRDGGAVPLDGVVIVAPPEPAEPSPLQAPELPADDGNPLQAALAAQERAEQIQREHQARQAAASPIDQHVDAIPGLSEHKRAFLKSNPELLRADVAPLVARAHQQALAAGIADDSEQMNRAVMDGVVREIQARRELTSASARPTEDNRDVHRMAADLEREAAEFQHEAERPIAAPIAPRRSIPMSAPVSRNIPSMSGQPRQSNTLSPQEIQVARNSFTDPNMSNSEKELLYLRNRQKYQRMLKDGSYSTQGDG